MRPNTLNTPKGKDIAARRKRQRTEALLALILFVALAIFTLAGISLANGNTHAVIYIGLALVGAIPAIIYLNKEEEKA